MVKKHHAIKKTRGEQIFDVCNVIFLLLIAFVTVFPFIMIVSGSLSDINYLVRNEVFFYPKGFTLEGYKEVIEDGQIFQAYYNTIFYTVVGTCINLLVTMAAAYPLSRKGYKYRNPIMMFICFTMFFSGGMVPTYLLINQLGLYNTRWVMLLPGAVSVTNLVMARVFLSSNIPDELSESAKIDGANDFQIFFRIVLPLSKAIIAVLALYYGVGHWNEFFKPMLYLRDAELTPLALYLRRLLVIGGTNYSSSQLSDSMMIQDPIAVAGITERIKYCSIIITMLPILFIYPFFQKYFSKGVMIGALKA